MNRCHDLIMTPRWAAISVSWSMSRLTEVRRLTHTLGSRVCTRRTRTGHSVFSAFLPIPSYRNRDRRSKSRSSLRDLTWHSTCLIDRTLIRSPSSTDLTRFMRGYAKSSRHSAQSRGTSPSKSYSTTMADHYAATAQQTAASTSCIRILQHSSRKCSMHVTNSWRRCSYRWRDYNVAELIIQKLSNVLDIVERRMSWVSGRTCNGRNGVDTVLLWSL